MNYEYEEEKEWIALRGRSQLNREKWYDLLNSFIKPHINIEFHWGRYFYQNIHRNVGKPFVKSYCNLTAWMLEDKSLFILLSKNRLMAQDKFHLNTVCHYIAMCLDHIAHASRYKPTQPNLNKIELFYKNATKVRFFLSHEEEFIKNAPCFYEVKFSSKKDNNRTKTIFYDPQFIRFTKQFIYILSKNVT